MFPTRKQKACTDRACWQLVGTAMGVVSALYTLSKIVSPMLSAYLFLQYNTYHPELARTLPGIPWLISAFFLVLAMLCLALRGCMSKTKTVDERRVPLLKEEHQDA